MADDTITFAVLCSIGVIAAIVTLDFLVQWISTGIDVWRGAKEVMNRIKAGEDAGIVVNAIDGGEFSDMFHRLYIKEGDWVIDTGNYANVNYPVMTKFVRQVRKHPFIFALFFHN